MIVAHLSDLHLRGDGDVVEFGRQLDRIAARRPDHTVITGDLLDRWTIGLLQRALDAIESRGLLDPELLTIIHGNHDLASSGGHPRERMDLWRLALRAWDPPPLLRLRMRRFYAVIRARCEGVGARPASAKTLPCGLRLATVDSVPAWWIPFSFQGGGPAVHHAAGAIDEGQLRWLSSLDGPGPLAVLIHHYPLPVEPFYWTMGRGAERWPRWLMKSIAGGRIAVRMAIAAADRDRFWDAAEGAGACAVLCGHVHRARLEHHRGIAVGLNGQSGAAWAGRTIAYYRIERESVAVEYERE